MHFFKAMLRYDDTLRLHHDGVKTHPWFSEEVKAPAIEAPAAEVPLVQAPVVEAVAVPVPKVRKRKAPKVEAVPSRVKRPRLCVKSGRYTA